MHLITIIVIGLLIGLIARWVTPGRTPGGVIVTIAVGIIGSVIATFAGQAIGWYRSGQSAGFLASIVGAVAFLLLLRALGVRSHRRVPGMRSVRTARGVLRLRGLLRRW